MDYPDWSETRHGMWAAELKFPMIDDDTPTFMGRPLVTDKKGLEGADVVVIGSPYVSSSSDEWAGVGKEHWLAAPQRVRQQSIRYQSGYVQDFRLNVFDHLNVVDYGDADIPPEANWGKLNPELILEAQAAVESKVNDALDVGALPVVLGQNSPCGSYAIAKCVAEHAEGNVGVVSLDTHWDIFRLCPQTKDPRIAGGFCWLYKTIEFHDNVHARNLVEIGPRGMLENSDVVEELIERGAMFYSGWDVRRQGIEAVCKGLDHAYNGTKSVYGHFDMDVIGRAGARRHHGGACRAYRHDRLRGHPGGARVRSARRGRILFHLYPTRLTGDLPIDRLHRNVPTGGRRYLRAARQEMIRIRQ